VVEQEVAVQGIKMFRGVELIFVTKQKIVILPKEKPIVVNFLLDSHQI
jgi:hypothetical protein